MNITTPSKISGKSRWLPVFSLVALALMLFYIEAVIDGTKSGLSVCARAVIPALFPFMALSEMIVQSGACDLAGRAFERPFSRLFKISGSGVCPVFLGALCGFPIGAKTAVSLYEQGWLNRDETERLIAFSNLTGPAFVVGGVGAILWKSTAFGIALYIIQILSAITVGLLLARTRPKSPADSGGKSAPLLPPKPPALSRLIAEGVSRAALALLPVCGYVVFFSAVSRVVSVLLSGITENAVALGFVYTLLEVGSGSAMAAAVGAQDIVKGAALAAFAVGWSGLSVHFQTLHFAAKCGLSLKRYFYGKLLSGVLSTFFVLVAAAVWPSLLLAASPTASLPAFMPFATPLAYTVNILFGAALTAAAFRKLSAKNDV